MLKCSAGKRRWRIRKSCEEGGSVGPILCHQGWGHLAERCGQPRQAVQLLAPKPWVLPVPQGPRLCCTRTPAAACPLPWALTSPRLSPGVSSRPRGAPALCSEGRGPGTRPAARGCAGAALPGGAVGEPGESDRGRGLGAPGRGAATTECVLGGPLGCTRGPGAKQLRRGRCCRGQGVRAQPRCPPAGGTHPPQGRGMPAASRRGGGPTELPEAAPPVPSGRCPPPARRGRARSRRGGGAGGGPSPPLPARERASHRPPGTKFRGRNSGATVRGRRRRAAALSPGAPVPGGGRRRACHAGLPPRGGGGDGGAGGRRRPMRPGRPGGG